MTQYLDSVNRSSGLVNPPLGVVIHFMGGGYDGSVDWLRGPPHSQNTNSSAHFTVAHDGRTAQLVPLPGDGGPQDGRYKAWHVRSENPYYIGVEHEGYGAPDDWTEAMLRASAAITGPLAERYAIPIVTVPDHGNHNHDQFRGFLGHMDLANNDHDDPGPHFPWDKYLQYVRESIGVVPAPAATLEENAMNILPGETRIRSVVGRSQVLLSTDLGDATVRIAIGHVDLAKNWHGSIIENQTVASGTTATFTVPGDAQIVSVVHKGGQPVDIEVR